MRTLLAPSHSLPSTSLSIRPAQQQNPHSAPSLQKGVNLIAQGLAKGGFCAYIRRGTFLSEKEPISLSSLITSLLTIPPLGQGVKGTRQSSVAWILGFRGARYSIQVRVAVLAATWWALSLLALAGLCQLPSHCPSRSCPTVIDLRTQVTLDYISKFGLSRFFLFLPLFYYMISYFDYYFRFGLPCPVSFSNCVISFFPFSTLFRNPTNFISIRVCLDLHNLVSWRRLDLYSGLFHRTRRTIPYDQQCEGLPNRKGMLYS